MERTNYIFLLDFYNASSRKHVSSIGHIILIRANPVSALLS